MHGETVKKN